jgi:hypothetical protein
MTYNIELCTVSQDLNDLIQYIEYVKKCIIIVKQYAKKDFQSIGYEISLKLSIILNDYNMLYNQCSKEYLNQLQKDIYMLHYKCRLQYKTYISFLYRNCIDSPFITYGRTRINRV